MTVKERQWDALEEYRDSLEHYGVKGMKWGVRKDRDKGTGQRKATTKQKLRAKQRMGTLAQRQKQRAARKEEMRARAQAKKAAKAAKRHEENLRSPTKLYKHRREYSQEEINAALKQFEWEKKIQDYSMTELNRGQQYIDTMFKTANSAINLYNTAARIRNTLQPGEKPWRYVEAAKTDKKKDDKKDKK